jgi:ribonuclease P protein component
VKTLNKTKKGQGTKRSFKSLRYSSDFRILKQYGARIQTYNFLIHFQENNSKLIDHTRVGLTVSTKIDKRAVVRNRIKRLIKEALVLLLPKITAPMDIVVIARKNLADISLVEVVKELRKALSSHKLIKA